MGDNRAFIIDRGFDTIAHADDLRDQVRALGLSKIAKRTGLSHTLLSLWLAGKRDMSLESRLRVAKACGRVVLVRVGGSGKRAYRRRAVETDSHLDNLARNPVEKSVGS